MQLQTARKKAVRSNAASLKSQSFEIGNAAVIIDILRNRLYANPIQTLVQEYLSNARDANREANATQRIQVSIPTEESPLLSIRDYGPGLSPERVAEVFIKYGNSTKRNSNRETGGFGIGAKSAWAYTDSFVIQTWHGGKAYHYVAHVTKEQTGSLDLVSEAESDAPTGTEIQIPVAVDDIDEFSNAVARAIEHWNVKEFPETHGAVEKCKAVHHMGRFQMIPRSVGDRHDTLIIVDGIPYDLPGDLQSDSEALQWLRNTVGGKTTLHFKTGEIEIAASRESITDHEKNRNAIDQAANDAKQAIERFVKNEMKAAKTLRGALTRHRELAEDFSHHNPVKLSFGGDDFQLSTKGGLTSDLFKNVTLTEYTTGERTYGYSRRRGRSRMNSKGPEDVDFTSGIGVYSDDETSHTNQTRRMKFLMQSNGKDCAYLLSGSLDSKNLKKLAMHLEINGTSSLGPATARKKRESQADVLINCYVKTTSKQTVSKMLNLDRVDAKYVYVVQGSKTDKGDLKHLNALFHVCEVNFVVINAANAKRVEGNPSFVSYDAFLKEWTNWIPKAKHAALIDTFKSMILGRYGWREGHNLDVYRAVLRQRLKDKALVKAMRTLVSFNESRVFKVEVGRGYGGNRLHETDAIRRLMGVIPEIQEFRRQDKAMKALKKKYVLLHCVDSEKQDGTPTAPALALYLNTAFRRGR